MRGNWHGYYIGRFLIDIQALSDDDKKELIKDIIQRMCVAYGFEVTKGFQKVLTEHLGLSESTVKSWVFNKRIPFEVMLECAGKTNTSFDWLMTGVEPAPNFTKETEEKVKTEVTELVVNAIRFDLLSKEDGPDVFATGVVNVVREVLY